MADRALVRDGDEGLEQLYNMARGFIHSVLPLDIISLIEEHGVSGLMDDVVQNWQQLVFPVLGFGVCIVIGLLFVLCVPCAGCCTCCCRTCCCCRGKNNKPPSKYKQATCTVILFVITAFMLSAVVCSYLTLMQLKFEVSSDGFLNDIVQGLDGAQTYVQNTGQQINEAAVDGLSETAVEIEKELNSLADTSIESLAETTGIQPTLDDLVSYVNGLPGLENDLQQIEDSWGDLDTYHGTLDTELATRRAALTPLLGACSPADPRCTAALADLPQLEPEATYDPSYTLAVEIAAINAASGVIDDLNEGLESMQNASASIDAELRTYIDDAITSMNDSVTSVGDQVEEFTTIMTEFDSLTSMMGTVEDMGGITEQYGTYGALGLMGLTSICAAVSILLLFGLICGTVGTTGSYKHGANCLLAGAALFFIFSWLTMMLTLLTFLTGALTESVVCQHLVRPDDTITRLLDIAEEEGMFSPPEQLQNISIAGILGGCKDDKSIYQVIDPAETFGVDINALVDDALESVSDALADIKATPIDVPEITAITDDTAQVLNTLYAQLNAIDFARYRVPLSEDITKMSVSDYVATLKAIGNPAITTEADLLDATYTNTIIPMENARAEVEKAIDDSETFISSEDVPDLVSQLNYSQIYFNAEADAMIGGTLNDTVDGVFGVVEDFVDSLLSSLENDIGQCRPLYDAIFDLIFAPCVYLLNPVQSIWFNYGWFLAFGLVGLGFMFSLADQFRALAEKKKVNPAGYDGNEELADAGNMKTVVPPVPLEPLPQKKY